MKDTNKIAWLLGILITLLCSIAVGLGAWNLQATHDQTAILAALVQKVSDGKEQRVLFEASTKEHFRIVDGELDSHASRITVLETKNARTP